MSFFKRLSRKMELDRAMRLAVWEAYEASSIENFDQFNTAWQDAIKKSQCQLFRLVLSLSEDVPFDFLLRLFVKLDFSGETTAKLLRILYKEGKVTLASAEEELLYKLENYLLAQAKRHQIDLQIKIENLGS